MTEKERLLRNVMEHEFVMNELVLYLNTRPHDKKALALHRTVADKLKELTERYEEKFGALTSKNNKSTEEWTWALEPWPWDN